MPPKNSPESFFVLTPVIQGVQQNALRLDGVDDYIDFGANPSAWCALDMKPASCSGGGFSLAFWTRIRGLSGDTGAFIGNGGIKTNAKGFGLRIGTDNVLEVRVVPIF